MRWSILVVLLCAGILSRADAEIISGITTDNRLIRFDSASPGIVISNVGITGLDTGQSFVGIDLRPLDLALVGLGYNAATGTGQVYNINRNSGAATPISGAFPLTATAFGVDFNPVPNALRIVTNGVGVDNNFRITMGGAGMVNMDGRLNVGGFQDPGLGIVGVAYANNVPGGIGGQTTLYVADGPSGQLYTQGTANFPPGTSPNTGTLFLVGSFGLGTNLPGGLGFDISGATGVAFLSVFSPGSGGALYQVNLSNGSTTSLGGLGANVVDVTVDPVPEPATTGLIGAGLSAMIFLRRNRSARSRMKRLAAS